MIERSMFSTAHALVEWVVGQRLAIFLLEASVRKSMRP